MSSDNVFGVEPPRDANGKVIPFDTEILYEKNGLVFYVADFRYSPKSKEWFASGGYTGNKNGWCAETNISETWFVASVNCRSCCAQVVSQGMETKTAEMANESAISAWNKRVIDRDELLKIADELENKFFVVYDSHGEIDHADCFVERIMKAVDA